MVRERSRGGLGERKLFFFLCHRDGLTDRVCRDRSLYIFQHALQVTAENLLSFRVNFLCSQERLDGHLEVHELDSLVVLGQSVSPLLGVCYLQIQIVTGCSDQAQIKLQFATLHLVLLHFKETSRLIHIALGQALVQELE